MLGNGAVYGADAAAVPLLDVDLAGVVFPLIDDDDDGVVDEEDGIGGGKSLRRGRPDRLVAMSRSSNSPMVILFLPLPPLALLS